MNQALARIVLCFVVLVASLSGLSQEGSPTGDFDQQDPYMSDLYMKGTYLLYDCSNGHWVCTRLEEFERCQRWREEARALKNDSLKCAPMRKFAANEKCVEEQQRLINLALRPRLCAHPEKRQEENRY